MCLIAFAIDADPACPLLVAANRDEFFDRPTAALHRWTLDGDMGVWAGRDLRDGGTWLGVSEAGRVAMLTNVRSARPGSGPRSRGELPTRWLQGNVSLDALANGIEPAAYAGFNLVLGDLHGGGWTWLGNRDPTNPHNDAPAVLHRQTLGPGVYGLSNATLDTPWPKSDRLKQAVREALVCLPSADEDGAWLQTLAAALADDRPAGPHELPATGVPNALERVLSSPFVKWTENGYGTRSSLVLRVHPGANPGADRRRVALHAWTHTPGGWSDDSRFSHELEI